MGFNQTRQESFLEEGDSNLMVLVSVHDDMGPMGSHEKGCDWIIFSRSSKVKSYCM